jgi:hypothetical protein
VWMQVRNTAITFKVKTQMKDRSPILHTSPCNTSTCVTILLWSKIACKRNSVYRVCVKRGLSVLYRTETFVEFCCCASQQFCVSVIVTCHTYLFSGTAKDSQCSEFVEHWCALEWLNCIVPKSSVQSCLPYFFPFFVICLADKGNEH